MSKAVGIIKTKQFGMLLIAVGIFIPLILYPFTTETTEALLMRYAYAKDRIPYDGVGLNDLRVVFFKVAIPYKYPVALGILFVFIGSCFVIFFKKGGVIYL
jgi:hypothetical protein